MKLSKRETIMIVALVFVVMIASFWFLILSPARDQLSAAQLEYTNLKAADDANQAIIRNVASLQQTQQTLKDNITSIEDNLLPELDTEVISEHLANIFEDNGMKFITKISCDPIVTEQLLLADGTYAADSLQWVRVNMKVSGTDGVTEGGIPAVGYDQFMNAVKEIEVVNPDSVHISAISMEETEQGFQYFLISVDVFAFNLTNRISEFDPSEPYITWDRESVVTGGIFGIPYDRIFTDKIDETFFRPFATVQNTGGTPDIAVQDTAVPTEPAA